MIWSILLGRDVVGATRSGRIQIRAKSSPDERREGARARAEGTQ